MRFVPAIALAILVAVCALPSAPNLARAGAENSKADAQPGQAMDFTLKDLTGKAMTLSDLRGHPVIVEFWATWCPPCRKQIPELESIYQRYRSRGLMVIGVACDTIRGDGIKAVVPFVKRMGIGFPILLADDALADRLDLDYIPTTLFLDREGKLVSRMLGRGRRGELAASVRTLVGD